MCVAICEEGDLDGVPPDECAIKIAEAGKMGFLVFSSVYLHMMPHDLVFSTGADIIGINCHFGPIRMLATMRIMKEGLERAGIKKHLMIQPLGYLTPEIDKVGFTGLQDFPYGNNIIIAWGNACCTIMFKRLFEIALHHLHH